MLAERWFEEDRAQTRADALCNDGTGEAVALFFSEQLDDIARAKAICATCPLQEPCLAGAVARREPWGVWGGEIFERGAVVPRKRPRGRPRKEDVAREAAERAARSQEAAA